MKMRKKKTQLRYSPQKPSLRCTCCGEYYYCLWTEQQARYCASYFYIDQNNDYAIAGSYPSSFDDLRFTITYPDIVQARHVIAINNRENTKDKWGHYNDSKLVVCDFCINKFLKRDYIEIDTTYNPYEVIDELNSFYNEDPVLYMEIMQSGPYDCMRLIREEKEKSIEQRMQEKEIRYKNRSIESEYFDTTIN